MAHKKNTTNLTELLLQCVTQPDPMLSMPEWLCTHLMVPKVRQGDYIPFFVTERKRSEAMLVQVVQEAFVQGVSTRKMEKLAHSLGIENLSRSQVSEMTKGLNERVEEFRNRSLADTVYPVLWVDALYEKVRVDGRIVSMTVLIVCSVDENGHRDIIAVEPMAEESRSSHGVLFQNLKDRGLSTPRLIISDAHSGRVSAIRESFSGASWQRCKVHFMRNILAYVPQKEKKAFAAVLKEIWLAPTAELARKRTYDVIDSYAKRFPNESSYVRLVTTYLMEYAEDWSVSRAYLSQKSIAATLTTAA